MFEIRTMYGIHIETIKNIHLRKKRADTDSIVTDIRDVAVEEVKSLLNELCEENVLKLSTRAGKESYRFCNESEQITDDEAMSNDEQINSNDIGINLNLDFKTPDSNFNLLQQKIRSAEKFNALDECLRSVSDLKEFISYEVNKLRKNKTNELVEQLKEENKFLKNEIKESREIIKNVFDNITRNSNKPLPLIIDSNKQPENNWKRVSKGPSRSQPIIQKSFNNDFISANRFEALSVNNCFNDLNDDNDPPDTPFSPRLTTRSRVGVPNGNFQVNENPVINQRTESVNKFPERNLKNIRILSDSIPKGIRTWEFNKYVKSGSARIKSFPGTTTKQLRDFHSIPTLQEEKPDIVIIHSGINYLLSTKENAMSEEEICGELMDMGIKCKEYNVETVFISGITYCRKIDKKRLDRMNKILKEESEKHGFIYIDNGKINGLHVWKDGIHLNENGKILLANNFIDSVNHF